MATQLPEEEKKKVADVVVYNDETQLLVPQILQLHNQFLKLN
jgi:dephospho-CoA kinase